MNPLYYKNNKNNRKKNPSLQLCSCTLIGLMIITGISGCNGLRNPERQEARLIEQKRQNPASWIAIEMEDSANIHMSDIMVIVIDDEIYLCRLLTGQFFDITSSRKIIQKKDLYHYQHFHLETIYTNELLELANLDSQTETVINVSEVSEKILEYLAFTDE